MAVKRQRKAIVESSVITLTKQKPVVQENLLTFKKLGGGALYLKNRIIKPGQVFQATWEEIPSSFQSSLMVMEGIIPKEKPKEVANKEVVEIPTAKFEKQVIDETEEIPQFNVVNVSSGKAINESPLTEEEADILLKAL